MRTLALPEAIEHWSLTTMHERLIKIGAKVVRHGQHVTFRLAEVAILPRLFAAILRLIDSLRPRPPQANRAWWVPPSRGSSLGKNIPTPKP